MKWVIRAVLGLVLIAVIAVGAAFAMLMTFDPNNYKDEITVAVEKATGREFKIAGDIKATLYPVLGFEVSDIQMSNPPSFAEKDFLKVGSAKAGVELAPLLQKQIKLTKVVLNEPHINVIKRSDGTNNLSFSGTKSAKAKEKGDAPKMDLSVGAIEISNAKMTYTDKATGKTIIIDPMNMTLPGYSPGKETDVAINMTVKNGDSAMKVDGKAKAKALPEEGSLSLSNVKADIIMTAPTFKDDVKVALAGSGAVNGKTQDLNLKIPNLAVNWQGTSITGQTDISGKFSAPVAKFAANAQTINIDNLLAGMNKSADKNAAEKQLLPIDMLRTLNMSGDISVGELVFNGLSILNAKAKVNAQSGLVNISPMTADFYDGKADASITIDARPSTPVFTLKNDVKGVKIGKVLTVKMGDDYITGKANVSYNLNAAGNSISALQKSSGGTVSFSFGEGYINKWQLSRLLNQAIAFFKTGAATDGGDRIHFTALTGTFNGQNGVFRNSDLVMTGPEVHALGAGTVNLAAQNVDYKINVGLGENPDSSKRHIPISIRGPLSAPQYGLDTKSMVVDEVKTKLQDKLFEKLGGGTQEGAADGSAAGSEAGSSKDAAPAPTSNEEAAKKLINGLFGQ